MSFCLSEFYRLYMLQVFHQCFRFSTLSEEGHLISVPSKLHMCATARTPCTLAAWLCAACFLMIFLWHTRVPAIFSLSTALWFSSILVLSCPVPSGPMTYSQSFLMSRSALWNFQLAYYCNWIFLTSMWLLQVLLSQFLRYFFLLAPSLLCTTSAKWEPCFQHVKNLPFILLKSRVYVHLYVCCSSAVRRSFVRNRGLLFFIPGVLLFIVGILVIVSTWLKVQLDLCLIDHTILRLGHVNLSWDIFCSMSAILALCSSWHQCESDPGHLGYNPLPVSTEIWLLWHYLWHYR